MAKRATKNRKLMAWNVNGLRAAAKKGFLAWLERARPDALGLQEVRAFPEQLAEILPNIEALGYRLDFLPAERPGYSGVAVFSRLPVKSILAGLGSADFDKEGRLLTVEYDDFYFASGYFPKGSGKERDNSRVPFKLAFYEESARCLARLARRKPVIVGGDFNTAHAEIDLANWKTNAKTSGFLPIEREAFGAFLATGFRDVFRDHHPGEAGHYTWWTQRMGARERNVGWRIDYLLASEALAPRVRRSWIEPETLGSDHCPIGIEIA